MGLCPVRPRVDHPVDRPELYKLKGFEVTGTNGRMFDHFYRSSLHKNVLGGRGVAFTSGFVDLI